MEDLPQDSISVMEATVGDTLESVILGDCDCLPGVPTLRLAGDARVLASYLLHDGHDRWEPMLYENLPCAEEESHDTNTTGDPLDQEGDNYDPSDLGVE